MKEKRLLSFNILILNGSCRFGYFVILGLVREKYTIPPLHLSNTDKQY